jgi:cytoskeletal protein CcmA (bactofilin family)
MFKKYSKGSSEKEVASLYEGSSSASPFSSEVVGNYTPLFSSAKAQEEDSDEPETTIAENVSIKGTLKFARCLRIDGSFEGELDSKGKLIIGPTGSVTANLNLEEAFISGKLVGDITVKTRLVLRGRAEIHGAITAPLLSVDEGVSIIGQLNVSDKAPVDNSPILENELSNESGDELELPF